MREGTCQRGGQCAIIEVQLQRHCMTAGMPAPRRTQTRGRALRIYGVIKKKNRSIVLTGELSGICSVSLPTRYLFG